MEDAKQKALAKAKKKAILLRAVVCAALIGTAIMCAGFYDGRAGSNFERRHGSGNATARAIFV